MHALTESLADSLRTLPFTQPVAAVDPNAVLVSIAADRELTYGKLDRWSACLVRPPLRIGADRPGRVTLAITAQTESVVAQQTIVKISGMPVPADPDRSLTLSTPPGVTMRTRRPEFPVMVEWLVLDGPSPLRPYCAGSDAPVTRPIFRRRERRPDPRSARSGCATRVPKCSVRTMSAIRLQRASCQLKTKLGTTTTAVANWR